jgi:transcriptional regulator with XRE-family HTH domain
MSATSFAHKIGIDKSLVSRYLAEKATPHQQRLDEIARYFNVSHGWLMGYDCEMHDNDLKSKIIKSLEKLSQSDMVEIYSFMQRIISKKK